MKKLLINITKLKELITNLVDEYQANIKAGRRSSDIRIRLDCLLKSLMETFNTTLVGKPTDKIIEIDL